MPVRQYLRRLADLGEYAGIATEDLDTSDFGPGIFTCTWGEGGNRFRLHDEEPPGGAAVLTLREMGGREVSDFLPSESGEAVAPPHADLFAAQMF